MNFKIIDGTHCEFNGNVYHIAQLTVEMIATLKAEGCKFSNNDRFFRLQDSYVVNVGNLGNVLESHDLQVAISHYEEYCKLSASNYGRVANEPVCILCNGEPMPEYEYFPNSEENSETPYKRHWCGYVGFCGEEDCNCCESNPRLESRY